MERKRSLKKHSVTGTALRLAFALDSEPLATIAFALLCAGGVIAMMLGYNSVVPAYQ